jgi:hypothetical protein
MPASVSFEGSLRSGVAITGLLGGFVMVSEEGADSRRPSGEGITVARAGAGDLHDRDIATRIQRLRKRIRWSANWFFGIALLSLVHSAFELTGLGAGSLAGLGVGRMINLYALSLADELGFPMISSLTLLAFGFNVIVAAFFVIMGFVARQEFRLAFLLGIFSYLLDGIILLGIQDYQGMVFHGAVLFLLARGLSFCKELEILQAWWDKTRGSKFTW